MDTHLRNTCLLTSPPERKSYKKAIRAVFCTFVVLAAGILCPTSGQSLSPELDTVTKSIENYFRQKRPDWKHESVPPGPLGTPFSPTIVVYFWWSDKCLTAEVLIDGKSSGRQAVPCRFKLAITQSQSGSDTLAHLIQFVRDEPSASPVAVGDKGYFWRGTDLVFIKGKFTFWLNGSLQLRVGDFTNNKEFIEKLAKEIADSVVLN
jgi:hypothetical protein